MDEGGGRREKGGWGGEDGKESGKRLDVVSLCKSVTEGRQQGSVVPTG